MVKTFKPSFPPRLVPHRMAESDNSVCSTRPTATDDSAAADNRWGEPFAPRRLCHRDLWIKCACAAAFAATLGWMLFVQPAARAPRSIAALANLLAPLVAMVISVPPAVRLWRLRRSASPDARPDLARLASAVAFGLTFVLFAGGQGVASGYALLGSPRSFPSWADAFHLGAYPCLIAAVLLLPSRRLTALQRGRVLMDSLMTLAAVATFSWYFLLGPAVLHAAATPLAAMLAAAYPVADLLVLFCLLVTMALARCAPPRRGMMPLCLGLLLIVLTDVVFGYQTLRNVYVPGSIVEAGWPAAYLLLAMGARALASSQPLTSAQLTPAETPASAGGDAVASGIAAILPYALVPLVGALVLGTLYEPDGTLVAGVYAGAALIVLLVVLRQVLAIRQNARLYAEVSRAYAELAQSHRSLESANAALARSEGRFRAAAECASDLVYEVDFETASVEWLGGSNAHGVSLPRSMEEWKRIVHPDDAERVVAAVKQHAASGEKFEVEYRVSAADGQYRYWVDRARSMCAANGLPVKTVGAVSDVTERKRAETLEGERAGLRQAVSAMEGVLGVVGHELRTPLAGLRAMSEFLLTDGAVQSSECEQMLAGINEEVVRMSETVNDLLEAARLNSGLAKWKWSRFELGPACADALEPIRALVDEAAVRLECDVEAGCAMRGDANAVRRLVLNLLSNARRFTTAGTIRVAARQTGDGGDRWVEVTVTDTGAGIPPEIRDRLGEAFALNAGLVGPNHVSGTGLGLAICKGIAAAHGGTLSIQSEMGKGTTVVARLRADLDGATTEHGKGAVAGLETWAMCRAKH